MLVGDITTIPMRKSDMTIKSFQTWWRGTHTDLYYADLYDKNGSDVFKIL